MKGVCWGSASITGTALGSRSFYGHGHHCVPGLGMLLTPVPLSSTESADS